MKPLYIDERWDGAHGIGRYAREVVSRFDLEWRPLGRAGSPSSPLDAFIPVKDAQRNAVVYSPGYNVIRGAQTQVVTVHDLIHRTVPWPGRLKYLAYYDLILRPQIRKAGLVFTVSEVSREAIAEWLRDDRVDIVNAGIGTSAAFTVEGERAPTTAPYVMYVGNMRAHKNTRVLMHAMALLPELRLKMLIPRAEAAQAREVAACLGITGAVDLVHDVDDQTLAALYRGAAVTAMPSLHEGFGLPPLESIMTGTPVVYWAGCSAVAETSAGFGTAVTSPADPREWADAIEHEARLGRVIRPPRDRYDWDTTAATVQRNLLRVM